MFKDKAIDVLRSLFERIPSGPWQVSGIRQKIGNQPILTIGPDGAEFTIVVMYSDLTYGEHVRSHAEASAIVCSIRLARALSAPEMVEELARVIADDITIFDDPADERLTEYGKNVRAQMRADAIKDAEKIINHFALRALNA